MQCNRWGFSQRSSSFNVFQPRDRARNNHGGPKIKAKKDPIMYVNTIGKKIMFKIVGKFSLTFKSNSQPMVSFVNHKKYSTVAN